MKWFRLYSDMVTVGGYRECSLYNFRDQRIYTLNRRSYDFLESAKELPINGLEAKFGRADTLRLTDRLCAGKVGFIHRAPERYLDMPLVWDCGSPLQRAIVDYDGTSYTLEGVAGQLDALLCEHVELRIGTAAAGRDFIAGCLSLFDRTTVRSIHLVADYSAAAASLPALAEACPRLTAVSLCRAPHAERLPFAGVRVCCHQQSMEALDRSAVPMPLIVRRRFFCEARRFNPYFNRKVVIDRNGFLRNDLYQGEDFGHVATTPLASLPEDEHFTRLWHASADKVAELKGDPLRYARLLTAVPLRIRRGTYTYDYY